MFKSLTPYFVAGFIDAEGSFVLSFSEDPNSKTKWRVRLQFSIGLHKKDKVLLEAIQALLGGIGSITKHSENALKFKITSIKDIEALINFLEMYKLISQKYADFLLFKQAFEIFKSKNHLTLEGILKLVAIRASMNLGLTDVLKAAFPDVKPVERPKVTNQEIKDAQWVAGFVSGEGCFSISIVKDLNNKLKESVQLRFLVTQHMRDEQLMINLIKFLGCGKIYPSRNAFDYRVNKLSDLIEIIIPFFQKNAIVGDKLLDFVYFTRVAGLVKNKAHLTKSGLEEIKGITKNSRRDSMTANSIVETRLSEEINNKHL